MSWTEEKVSKLKELWGKGNTASQIAEIIGGISRNAVIGKAHRLNLSAKIKTRTATSNKNFNSNVEVNNAQLKRGRKSRFKSLIIEKDFEPENPKQLEELDESSCKWPIGHPYEKNFYFCGRSSLKDFSYCNLHLH
jgi:GcrA cell cycle regulator